MTIYKILSTLDGQIGELEYKLSRIDFDESFSVTKPRFNVDSIKDQIKLLKYLMLVFTNIEITYGDISKEEIQTIVDRFKLDETSLGNFWQTKDPYSVSDRMEFNKFINKYYKKCKVYDADELKELSNEEFEKLTKDENN